MNMLSSDLMAEATRLTRAGDTAAATVLIQSALSGPSTVSAATGRAESHSGRTPYQSPADNIAKPRVRVLNPSPESDPSRARVAGSDAAVMANVPAYGTPKSSAKRDIRTGTFVDDLYAEHGQSLAYKLYTPTSAHRERAPLLVMLHGCTQDAGDFALGTQMNTVAEQSGMYVLYPTQPASANMNRCWNWFEPAHQRRGSGEPAALVGLIRQITSQHPIDDEQIFVAGLSAGGAMALILAEQYPELFAGVGVHSGLPTGAASSIPEALSLMRNPMAGSSQMGALSGLSAGLSTHLPFKNFSPISGERAASRPTRGSPLPLIVFHGLQDQTVNCANGEKIVSNWLSEGKEKSEQRNWTPTSRTLTTPDGRVSTITTYVHEGHPERVGCEYWQLSQGAHCWSGGDAAGSHTDAQGPDASAQMMRFFMATRSTRPPS